MDVLPFCKKSRPFAAVAALGLAVALTAACGDSGDADPPAAQDPPATADAPEAGDDITLAVTTPAEGDTVTVPFEVSVDSSVELGAIDDQVHHMHIWFGDTSGQPLIIESDTTMIDDAPDGDTTMIVQVHTFDHQPASDQAMVPLMVEGGSGGESQDEDPGYGDY
ncbi:MAG: hypothetical protein GEV12_22635 [Micromonosporaceae bacterium]|nr:hypothetical protein [Micromonosporaceae bacterium]